MVAMTPGTASKVLVLGPDGAEPVTLRAAQPADVPALTALHQRCVDVLTGPGGPAGSLPVDVTSVLLELIGSAVALVAEAADGSLVAMSCLDVVAGVGVARVIVQSDRQGQGIADALAQRTLAAARSLGFAQLRLVLMPTAAWADDLAARTTVAA